MKKLIYCALALAAGLLATSCQQENLEPAGQGDTVTYTVDVPGVVTKAIADGKNVDRLFYEVYKTNAENTTDLSNAVLLYKKDIAMETSEEATSRAIVTLNLVQNQYYTVLFWAQCGAEDQGVYNVSNLKAVTYKDTTSMESNHENYAAFYAADFISDSTPRNKKVYLERPFAQLNIGTKYTIDYEKDPYAIQMLESEVTVKKVPTVFNVATSAVSGEHNFTFKMHDVLGDELEVNGEPYKYVAMNYMFAGAEGRTAEVSYKINAQMTTQNGDPIDEVKLNKTVLNVPLKENYRTNIVGNLLTSSTDYEVIVDADWAGEDLAPDALFLAAANGGEVTLTKDVELTTPLVVNSEMTINLNGKTISGEFVKGNGAVVNISEGASVILNGGTIKNTTKNGDAAINNEGTLVLNGVTIVGAPLADGGYSAYALISSGNMVIEEGTAISADRGSIKVTGAGETVINGGTFTNNDISPRSLTSHVVDVEDESTHKLTINGGTFQHLHTTTSGGVVICNRTKGTVYVNGGNFSGGNYYGNDNLSDYGYGGTFSVKGGVFSANPAAKYIADGYKAIAKDGKYHVVAEGTDAIVSSNEDFKNALDNGDKDINLLAGEYTFPGNVAEGVTINCAPGTVFTGTSGLNINGSTVIGATFENEGGVAVKGTIYGTFKNCTFVGEEALRWCYSTDGKDVVFEDCVIKTDFRGFHFDDMAGNVLFKNCEINGFNAYGGEGTATFENCVFGCDESNYNGLNTYANTVLTNCRFNFISGKTNFIDMEGTGYTVTITGCTATLDGVDTPVVDFVGGSKRDANTVILDGKVYASNAAQLTAAVNNGATDIVLAGEFEMPSNGTTNAITFSSLNGTAVIDNTKGSYWENATLTFNNISFKTGTGYVNGNGADYAALYSKNVTYNECNFNGPMRLGRDGAKFNACTFNGLGNDYVWTYGKSASFEGCTFNTEGKAILIYSDGPTGTNGAAPAVSVTNCTFNATQGAKAGAIANQNCAAVEIHNYGNGVTLTTSDNTVDEEFSGVWRIKTYENRYSESKIFVNETEYTSIALDGKTMTIDADKNVTVL